MMADINRLLDYAPPIPIGLEPPYEHSLLPGSSLTAMPGDGNTHHRRPHTFRAPTTIAHTTPFPAIQIVCTARAAHAHATGR